MSTRTFLAVLALAACSSTFAQEEPAAPPPSIDVTAVRLEPQEAGGAVLLVEASAAARYNTFRLAASDDKPERFVIDVQDSHWLEGFQQEQVGGHGILGWRASQFSEVPAVTRIVVELLDAGPIRVVSQSPAETIRIEFGAVDSAPEPGEEGPEEDPEENPEEGPPEPTEPGEPYEPPTLAEEWRPEQKLHLTSVESRPADDGYLELRLTFDGPADPLVFLYADPASLMVDVPNAAPEATEGVASGWVSIETPEVTGLRSVRLCEIPEDGALSSRLVVRLDRPAPYDLTPENDAATIWKLSVCVGAPLRGLVVIDPGHGGREAGAVGVGDTHEEDLTLLIARRLRSELMRRGVAAIMTRTADTYADLWHRPYIANELEADLFLSIHLNSSGSLRGSGTETFYYHDSGRPFAEVVQKAVLQAVGRPDRGVKRESFAVLREAKVPAALVEVLFLDNAEEAALITQDSFRARVASALADAIETSLKALER